jgi:hypothetical protein
MLCDDCVREFADHHSMKTFNQSSHIAGLDARQHAAHVLVALARNRRKKENKTKALGSLSAGAALVEKRSGVATSEPITQIHGRSGSLQGDLTNPCRQHSGTHPRTEAE